MAKGATRDTLRRHNLAAVLQRIHRRGPQSRSALTQATGLNRSTIGGLVAELEQLGLVEEGEPEATGTAGRPSPLVRPCTDHVVVAAVDIASKALSVAVGGVGGVLLECRKLSVDNDTRPYSETIEHVAQMLGELRATLQPGQQLYGVGIAAPGVVRSDDGFVHVAPNVGWQGQPLGADLRERLGPDIGVTVANEAHLGARAEHMRGAGVGVDDLFYLSGEIGVGGGAVVDGRVQVGADGYSGEIGHMTLSTTPDAARCRCGNTGCLEAETGALALLRLVGAPEDAMVLPAVRAVIEAAGAGDAEASAALEEIGRRLGRGLAGLVNLLNPRRLIVGGYFVDAFEWLEVGLDVELRRHALAPNLAGATIVPAALGEHSALVGALEIALAPLLADPAASSTDVAAATTTG